MFQPDAAPTRCPGFVKEWSRHRPAPCSPSRQNLRLLPQPSSAVMKQHAALQEVLAPRGACGDPGPGPPSSPGLEESAFFLLEIRESLFVLHQHAEGLESSERSGPRCRIQASLTGGLLPSVGLSRHWVVSQRV